MKKKIISLCLVIALVAIAVTGATFAYLQDADADANTMVAGNVFITQNETDRDGNAWADTNVVDLWPAVYYDENGDAYRGQKNEGPAVYKDAEITVGDYTVDIIDAGMTNEIDKIITVTNNGTEDAYVRTIMLFEHAGSDYVHYLGDADNNQTWEVVDGLVAVDGVEYEIIVCTYEDAVAAGATSAPSLKQVWLNPTAGNEWKVTVGDEYTILSLSQAVQAEGFNTATDALDLAFDDVTADVVAEWFGGTAIDTEGADNTIAAE